jgi:hypothetical protein
MAAERDDYSGEFDPEFRLEDLSKDALVRLCREFMQVAHLLDRAIFTAIGMKYGQEVVEELAIAEWMGASPIYTERIREVMAIEGDGVSAIFKSLQLDPGFPHEYMDVHYEVHDEHHGEFWLDYCGALMDVEPFGERSVIGMCHHIEDPTFDATVGAINPKARCRPIHRPPRASAEQVPHCRWEVTIDESNEPLQEADITKMVRNTTAATFTFSPVRRAIQEKIG